MSKPLKPYLKVKDFSVSGEYFDLIYDEALDLLITTPQPLQIDLPKYYESADYISHTDGKRSIFEKVYQLVKRIALNQKTTLLEKLHPNKGSLLDIGAGTGDFLLSAKQRGWLVAGSEPNEKARVAAAAKNVDLESETGNFADSSFDVITMWHVLEHVSDLQGQILELRRLIKPGGYIIIAVPNFKSYDAKFYGAYWAAYDVPRHLWHFSKTSVEGLFTKHGFQLEEVLPMKFDAYYVSLLSEKYKMGKMRLINASITAFRSNFKASKSGEFSSHIYIIKCPETV